MPRNLTVRRILRRPEARLWFFQHESLQVQVLLRPLSAEPRALHTVSSRSSANLFPPHRSLTYERSRYLATKTAPVGGEPTGARVSPLLGGDRERKRRSTIASRDLKDRGMESYFFKAYTPLAGPTVTLSPIFTTGGLPFLAGSSVMLRISTLPMPRLLTLMFFTSLPLTRIS